jgi:N-acetylglucosamine kinase-like BadF-type ATPase
VPLLIGIDAGGTSTVCAVERDGAVAQSAGAPVNLRTLGAERAAQRIAETIGEAAGTQAIDAVAIGAAGASESSLAQALAAYLRARFPRTRIAVYDDALIALRAGVPAGDGMVLIAGTGSVAYGIFGDRVVRAGGYGPLLGDEGSGFAIGRAALALTLRGMDGRAPADALGAAVAAAIGARDAAGLLARVHEGGEPVAAIAALAPLVVERAGSGERSASKIIQAAALDLSEMVKAVVKASGVAEELPLVFAGGLLAANSLLSFLIETRLGSDLPMLAPVKSPPAPVFGALAIAREAVAS